jgi:hypothetical protein
MSPGTSPTAPTSPERRHPGLRGVRGLIALVALMAVMISFTVAMDRRIQRDKAEASRRHDAIVRKANDYAFDARRHASEAKRMDSILKKEFADATSPFYVRLRDWYARVRDRHLALERKYREASRKPSEPVPPDPPYPKFSEGDAPPEEPKVDDDRPFIDLGEFKEKLPADVYRKLEDMVREHSPPRPGLELPTDEERRLKREAREKVLRDLRP